MNLKSALRKKIRQQLRQTDKIVVSEASKHICNHLKSFVLNRMKGLNNQSTQPLCIALFAAHGSEIQLQSLHQMLPGLVLVYPLCHPQGVLSFHHVDRLKTLTPGKYGILEPHPDTHPQIPISQIDLFLCPGLGFGRDFTRLGQGGGYYDRALATKSPKALSVGVGLDQQLHPSVPHSLHDVLLSDIVTESGFLSATTTSPGI